MRVGAVSYLNTKPLIFGFEQGMMKDDIDLVMDYPSNIAAMLLNDQIDIGLVPVTIIPEIKKHHIISDCCISCEGQVGSVGLFSDVPLSKIEKILLDYQSRSSVELLKILINEYWKIDPVLEMATHNYQENIKGTTAGLVIGDRAFECRKSSRDMFDLGLEWNKFTGLPFVFAAWVSNKEIDGAFIESFNKANLAGLQNIDEVVRQNPFSLFDLKAYYTKYINYYLDKKKEKAMDVFLQKSSLNVLT